MTQYDHQSHWNSGEITLLGRTKLKKSDSYNWSRPWDYFIILETVLVE